MRFIYWIACWSCYYLGDLASKILESNDNSEWWCDFWYPIYSKLMCWSSDIQDKAGHDPSTGADTTKWVWYKPDPQEDTENKE